MRYDFLLSLRMKSVHRWKASLVGISSSRSHQGVPDARPWPGPDAGAGPDGAVAGPGRAAQTSMNATFALSSRGPFGPFGEAVCAELAAAPRGAAAPSSRPNPAAGGGRDSSPAGHGG